jgi:hypothetical protein
MPRNDLSGVYDLHIHCAPDLVPRCVDDIDAATQARGVGMRGILLKSHSTCTSGRAGIAEKAVPGIRVFGSLALNRAVGGLNVHAVEAALRMGAREIFMPTLSADNDMKHRRTGRGIDILSRSSQRALDDILDLVRQYDVILGTGHLSRVETAALIARARARGIRKIVVTHPEHPVVDFAAAQQKSLSREGVYFERCFASTLPGLGDVPMERIAQEIRDVGAAKSILTTDLGRAGYPCPVEGMDCFITRLKDLGIPEAEIEVMTKTNPQSLVE